MFLYNRIICFILFFNRFSVGQFLNDHTDPNVDHVGIDQQFKIDARSLGQRVELPIPEEELAFMTTTTESSLTTRNLIDLSTVTPPVVIFEDSSTTSEVTTKESNDDYESSTPLFGVEDDAEQFSTNKSTDSEISTESFTESTTTETSAFITNDQESDVKTESIADTTFFTTITTSTEEIENDELPPYAVTTEAELSVFTENEISSTTFNTNPSTSYMSTTNSFIDHEIEFSSATVYESTNQSTTLVFNELSTLTTDATMNRSEETETTLSETETTTENTEASIDVSQNEPSSLDRNGHSTSTMVASVTETEASSVVTTETPTVSSTSDLVDREEVTTTSQSSTEVSGDAVTWGEVFERTTPLSTSFNTDGITTTESELLTESSSSDQTTSAESATIKDEKTLESETTTSLSAIPNTVNYVPTTTATSSIKGGKELTKTNRQPLNVPFWMRFWPQKGWDTKMTPCQIDDKAGRSENRRGPVESLAPSYFGTDYGTFSSQIQNMWTRMFRLNRYRCEITIERRQIQEQLIQELDKYRERISKEILTLSETIRQMNNRDNRKWFRMWPENSQEELIRLNHLLQLTTNYLKILNRFNYFEWLRY